MEEEQGAHYCRLNANAVSSYGHMILGHSIPEGGLIQSLVMFSDFLV